MRHILLYLALSASLAACDGDNSVRITTTPSGDDQGAGGWGVADALQCPDSLGVLTRKGLAAQTASMAAPRAPTSCCIWSS